MKKIIFLFGLIHAQVLLYAQTTPGYIYITCSDPTIRAVLDPNLDNYASINSSGYSNNVLTNTWDENQESEIPYHTVFHPSVEPSGDLQAGSSCSVTEIVDNPIFTKSSAFYYYYNPDLSDSPNGDEKLLFRVRLADVGSGAYGYSFLLDTDNKMGTGIDPNAVSGNPGFEIEILYGSGSGSAGVKVVLVDGTTNGTVLAYYPDQQRIQKSYIKNSNCTASNKKPNFLDFCVDYATISPYLVDGLFRMAWATSQSASSALGGSAADIGGVDDGSNLTDDQLFINVINSNPTQFTFTSNQNLPLTLGETALTCDQSKYTWTTLSEKETRNFTLELSNDLSNWEILATKPAAGNSNMKLNYELIHPKLTEANYLRLKLVNTDGSIQVLSTITNNCEIDRSFIFPNPATNTLQIHHEQGVKRYEVFNLNGQLMMEQDFEVYPHESNLNLSELKNGLYLIHIYDRLGKKQTQRFSKIGE